MSMPVINKLSEDIYFQREYSALYETDSEHFEYTYEEGSSYVRFSSLKRQVSYVGNKKINEELYDLETHYGYGGPVTNSNDSEFLQRAFQNYRQHCKQQNIVCEFIRFHPFNSLAGQEKLYDMNLIERQVVIVDLAQTSEDRRKLYSKTTRNIVKKAANRLIVDSTDATLSQFMDMYYQTMKKNDASDFFYFPESYFSQLKELDGIKLLGTKLQEHYTSIGFFMLGKELAHYHLSANNQTFSKENGNYLLLDAAFELAKDHGCRYFMLGGGRTSSEQDSLYRFKRKFSPHTLPFYIAGIDFIPEKRRQLNQLWIDQQSAEQIPKLFQLYRS